MAGQFLGCKSTADVAAAAESGSNLFSSTGYLAEQVTFVGDI